MKIRKATAQDIELLREFAIIRYIWVFAVDYTRAKKGGTLEVFWKDVKGKLVGFDEKNPTCRRQSTIGKTLLTGQTTIPLKSAIGQISTPLLSATKQTPAAKQKSAGREPSAAVQHSATSQPPVASPIPNAAPVLSEKRPVTNLKKTRARSRSPTPGPSRPRPPVPTAAPSSLSSIPSSYVAGYRIPGRPTPQNAKSKWSDVSSEYQPSIRAKPDLPSIKVKPVETKGKRKAINAVPKVEDTSSKKPRKQPQSSGELRDQPCKRCKKRKLTCYTQKGGNNACVNCARMKLRCEDVPDAKESKTKRTKAVEPEKKTRLAKPKSSRRDTSPADMNLSDVKYADGGIADKMEEDTYSASSSAPSAHKTKNRALSEKAKGKRAEWRDEYEGMGIFSILEKTGRKSDKILFFVIDK